MIIVSSINIDPEKVPGLLNSMSPEMILNKIKYKIEAISENDLDGWSSGADHARSVVNDLIHEYPNYQDYILMNVAKAIETLLMGTDDFPVLDFYWNFKDLVSKSSALRKAFDALLPIWAKNNNIRRADEIDSYLYPNQESLLSDPYLRYILG